MNTSIRPAAPIATLFDTDAQRWDAVRHRDARADGAFYYSVRTTGVYCRPSCAARLARRENVAFHATCEEAERAGFRPCKRCKPNQAGLARAQAAAVAAACRTIESSDADRATLDATGGGGRHEPLSLSPRLQSGHRRDAEGLRGCAPCRTRAP